MGTRFGNKYQAEKVPLSFDFSSELDTGETLQGTPTVTVTVLTGVDATPEALKVGAASSDVSGKFAIQVVEGGVAGVDYRFLVVCATSNPNKTLARIGDLYVE